MNMKLITSFVKFIREQGVVGFGIGFIMAGAISKLVSKFIEDILNPILGLLIGKASGLTTSYFNIGSAKIMWGDFVSSLIDFFSIAFIIYFLFKALKLEKLDLEKKK